MRSAKEKSNKAASFSISKNCSNRQLPLNWTSASTKYLTNPIFYGCAALVNSQKCTRLESQVYETAKSYGLGSAFYLNGDKMLSHQELIQILK